MGEASDGARSGKGLTGREVSSKRGVAAGPTCPVVARRADAWRESLKLTPLAGSFTWSGRKQRCTSGKSNEEQHLDGAVT